MPGPEWLLVAGIAAFYLQDAAVLLHYDEFVVGGSGRRWQASAGKAEWSGRYLCLPGPLAPHAAWFRGNCPANRDSASPAVDLDAYLAELAPFRVGAPCLGVVLLALVPALVLAHPRPAALLAALGVAYLILGVLVARLWRRRDVLGLSSRAAAWLAFECVACPPHGINLVRRLTLSHAPRGAAAAALSRVAPGDRQRMASVIAGRRALFGPMP